MKIAMWSGPRNLSTAMMYAFASRSDCAVWDEPFYAAYLVITNADHPMRAETIASGEVDPIAVSRQLVGENPNNRAYFYQKHMVHHMVPEMPMDWMADVRNVFLIRHPARVVASYLRKREAPVASDLGFGATRQIYDRAVDLGQSPIVIDSADIRDDPAGMLQTLCAALDMPWDPAMLSWPAGGRREDGAWAPHWYGAIHRSTGFDGPEGSLPEIPSAYQSLVEAGLAEFEMFRARALSPPKERAFPGA
ncbi:MAG: HAD family hydrolase [Pseudomonadota bacterium]